MGSDKEEELFVHASIVPGFIYVGRAGFRTGRGLSGRFERAVRYARSRKR